MQFFKAYIHQKVPKSGRGMPGYFRHALNACEIILSGYLLLTFFLIRWQTGRWEWIPAALCACQAALLVRQRDISRTAHLMIHSLLIFFWCAWYVITYGWGSGGQHFLVPLLILFVFNVYGAPVMKLTLMMITAIFRMGLFIWSINHTPVTDISHGASILFQTVNSVTFFLMLGIACLFFSSSIQRSEQELMIDNQALHREANTDPLTGLPNRRALQEQMNAFRASQPEAPFTVAIADIDLFKNVNDTYGHNCGDYTLKTLAGLFLEEAGTSFSVCRWGGEEFCFFLPWMNLDEAGIRLYDLHTAVQKMPLCYEGVEFSITITIGAEENDFRSSLEKIVAKADSKLYMGKVQGRNRVII